MSDLVVNARELGKICVLVKPVHTVCKDGSALGYTTVASPQLATKNNRVLFSLHIPTSPKNLMGWGKNSFIMETKKNILILLLMLILLVIKRRQKNKTQDRHLMPNTIAHHPLANAQPIPHSAWLLVANSSQFIH